MGYILAKFDFAMKINTLEQLAASQRNLEHILDHLPEGIIGHDLNRKIVYFNRTAEGITGYTKSEVVGKDCYEAFGVPFCGKNCSFCGQPPETWTRLSYPVNIVTKSGEPRQLQMSVVGMRDEQGRLVGVLAALQDITSLAGLKLWTEELSGFVGIVGRNPQLVQIFKQIKALAVNDYPVLIIGETGTGKELVAAAIHSESRRSQSPFVPVNCGALPEGVVESELFGHVKGAFSGAIRDKKGRFELAHRGTIFLDEVAELPKAVQVKLLRVLESGAFEPVGGEKTVVAEVRVISATNRDLKREVEKGHFRQDLYYRLNVVPVHLPPLRERRDDIPLLVEHFLILAEKRGQRTARFTPEALVLMRRYAWPGNVRELQNAVHYALARSDGALLGPEDLPPEVQRDQAKPGPDRKLEAAAVQAALKQCGGNKVQAAKLLGIGRATLYRFLKSHDTPVSHR